MKKITDKLFISTLVLSMGLESHIIAASLNCKYYYQNEKPETIASLPNFDFSPSLEYKDMQSNISSLERKLIDYNRKMSDLNEIINGKTAIPIFSKTKELLKWESKLRDEEYRLRKDKEMLSSYKSELEKATKYLKDKSEEEQKEDKKEDESDDSSAGTSQKTFSNFTFRRKIFFEKKWTENDITSLNEKIALFEERIHQQDDMIKLFQHEISLEENSIKKVMALQAKADLKQFIAKNKDRTEQLEQLNVKMTSLKEKHRFKASKELLKALADSRLQTPIKDLLGYHTLKNISKSNKVTLLVGNNQDGKKMNYQQYKQIQKIVENLVSRKYYILFDADSNYAPHISKLAGEFGIAISARSAENSSVYQNHVVISNDYLRMQILSESKAVVTTTDSISGMGLFYEGLATHVLDPKYKFETLSLESWIKDLDKRSRNLGISVPKSKVIPDSESLFEKPANSYGQNSSIYWPVDTFKPYLLLTHENLSAESIELVVKQAMSFAEVMEKNRNTGGSVIFGSSREDKHSANLIYQSAYKLGSLGIAVATGGSGGAMKIANTGAWNAGGPSIGIPIGGKHSLEMEREFASSVHTKTIATSGYEERIPSLLGEGKDSRKLIIFAPGGGGTIKELATTLVRAGGKASQVNKIVFLDSDYYKPLVNWIMTSDLPQSFKDKIVLIDKAEELEVLAKSMQENFEALRATKPRKAQLDYETKPKYESEGRFNSGKSITKSRWNNNNSSSSQDKKTSETPQGFKDSTEEELYYRKLYGDW